MKILKLLFRKLKLFIWSFIVIKILKLKYVWNPINKFPRNETCYCGSGLKYKKCCLAKEPSIMREDRADKVAKIIKKVRNLKAKK